MRCLECLCGKLRGRPSRSNHVQLLRCAGEPFAITFTNSVRNAISDELRDPFSFIYVVGHAYAIVFVVDITVAIIH